LAITQRDYGFLDWSGDSGLKFAVGSSSHLSLCFVSSHNYGGLHRGLLSLREQLGLPQGFEFHFARTSNTVRAAFFAVLLHLPWDGAVLLVDKQELPAEFERLREPLFYSHFVGHLLVSAPLSILQVKRLLVDESHKQTEIIRAMRTAMSPVLRARGIKRTPKVRGEPAHQWDGLQVADMLAGAVARRETGGENYLRGFHTLRVYRYEVQK